MSDELKELLATYAAIRHAAFTPDDSARECFVTAKSRRGGTRDRSIQVHRPAAHALLRRFEGDVSFLSRRYLRDLDRVLAGRVPGG
jgi:hypothetical protein